MAKKKQQPWQPDSFKSELSMLCLLYCVAIGNRDEKKCLDIQAKMLRLLMSSLSGTEGHRPGYDAFMEMLAE